MKICYMNWKSYAGEDLLEAFSNLTDPSGDPVEVIAYPFENTEKRTDQVFEERFAADLKRDKPDAVCSFNYYPLIALVCGREGLPYISIVYDSPHISLYSYTVLNPCNHIYVFDSAVAEEFNRQGINTVHYLPLAVNVGRMDAVIPDGRARERFDADVAFVGQLYTEDHTFYDRMEPLLDDYTRGYLQAVIDAQLHVDGVNFVQECLSQPIVDRLMEVFPAPPNADGVESSAWIYAQYMINRKVTQIERTGLLKQIGEHFGNDRKIALYTKDAGFSAQGVQNRGRIDYYDEMPQAFKCAKINLNLSLRSIHHGIPLRVFDIMGAGGFLLTNYQPDLLMHFVPGEDFVYYESNEDLLDKIDYYLTHDEEREAIARSGHDKVAAYHTWEIRLRQILQDVFELSDRKIAVFLPYKASMWDSLETVWRAKAADPAYNTVVVPIPYYDKAPDGSVIAEHWEIDQYPKDVPVVDYRTVDLEAVHPDEIFIHNPYDQYNHVTTVHPLFYASRLKDLTDQLVYIPYFVLGDIDPNNSGEVEKITDFAITPGVINAHRVIVQSEDMKKAYVNVLTGHMGEKTREVWESKIEGTGSPKVEKLLATRTEELDIPEDWRRIAEKPDGHRKKVFLYNTSVSDLLQWDEKMIDKIRRVFYVFRGNQEEATLLWRPHPLIEATLTALRPRLWEAYRTLRDDYINGGWGIYDNTPDLDRAILWSDAYYGDNSSVVWLYRQTGKPVMLQSPLV